MDREDYLRHALAEIHRQFQAACQPYLDELVRLESMKPSRPIVLNLSDIAPAILKQLKESL